MVQINRFVIYEIIFNVFDGRNLIKFEKFPSIKYIIVFTYSLQGNSKISIRDESQTLDDRHGYLSILHIFNRISINQKRL